MIGSPDEVEAERSGVLVLIKGLGIGGAEKLIVEAARHWDRSRFDYRVAYVLPWKDQLVSELLRSGIPVDCVGGRRGFDPATPWRLRKLIAATGPALIHAHLPTTGILARLVAPVPVVYTEHNLVGSYRAPVRAFNRLTYGRNAAVIAVSEAVARSAGGYRGPSPIVIPNGVTCSVSEEERKAALAELALPPGTPLVVHVGNVRPGKGHRTLLAAARLLTNYRPVIVSIGGEKAPGDLMRLREEASGLGVADTVRFLGRRWDALSFVAAADLVVNPADVEGLPLALLEAMSLGKPVVATAVGGVPSIVKDQETGILVPPGDPQALALGIERLLADRSLAAALAEAGERLIRTRFSAESMVRDIEDVYSTVLYG